MPSELSALPKFNAGDTVVIMVDTFDPQNPPTLTADTLTNVNTVTIDIYHENGTAVASAKPASTYATGRYRYRWQSTITNIEGYYYVIVTIDSGVANPDTPSVNLNIKKRLPAFYLTANKTLS